MASDTNDDNVRFFVPSDFSALPNVVRYEPRNKPSVDICAEPLISFSLNREWAKHIFGAIDTLTLWKAWTGEQDESNEAVQIIMSWLQSSCGVSEMSTIFREKPNDPCEVQYSIDGGDTWVYMFRKDNCVSAASGLSGIEINEYITETTNNYITYAGDIINVAPKWAYDAGYTDLALCWTIQRHVDIVCDFILSHLHNNEELLTISKFAETATELIMGAAVGIAASSGNVPAAAAGAGGWALAKIGFDILNSALENDRGTFEDIDARELVACWMYNNLKGATPQWSTWNTSLDDFAGGNENETAIAEAVGILNYSEDFYINYLIALEGINDITESLPPCPCTDGWTQLWDFTQYGPDDWYIAGDYGTFVDGQGWTGEILFNGVDYSNIIQNLRLDGPIPNQTLFAVRTNVVRGLFDHNITAITMYANPAEPIVLNQGNLFAGISWRNMVFPNQESSYNYTMHRSCYNDVGVNVGVMIIDQIRLSGTGINPFRHKHTSDET